MQTYPIAHHPERRVFELITDGHTADIEYETTEHGICITHTYVPPELGGRGLAAALARFALETARAQGWQVETTCSYFHHYLLKHPEYADICAP